ncbi:unnamed protein product [Moneuplotes crassus]|uniref:Uncharacterized protein n=1 Tax=Euplotes crassus TaxID=5936 RepID=A0AAD1XE63_EUPCR|nr:unnamed protein product [Moneuplotes crassus]
MYGSSIKKFQKSSKELFNKRNTISIEWPEYMSSNPHLVVMDNEKKYYTKGKINKLIKEEKTHKYTKNQNTNLKFGISKDSPFVNEYTEYHRLTKNLFHPSLEPKIKTKSKIGKKSRTYSKKVVRKNLNVNNQIANLKLVKVKQKVNEKLFTKMLSNAMSPEKQRKIKSRYDNYAKSRYERRKSRDQASFNSEAVSKNNSIMATLDHQERSKSIRVLSAIKRKPSMTQEPLAIKSQSKFRNTGTSFSKQTSSLSKRKSSKEASCFNAYSHKDNVSFQGIYQSHKNFYDSISDKNAFTDPRKKPMDEKLKTHLKKYKTATTLATANSVPSFARTKCKAKGFELSQTKTDFDREESIISSNIRDEYCNLDKDKSMSIIGGTSNSIHINSKHSSVILIGKSNKTALGTMSTIKTRACTNKSTFAKREKPVGGYF